MDDGSTGREVANGNLLLEGESIFTRMKTWLVFAVSQVKKRTAPRSLVNPGFNPGSGAVAQPARDHGGSQQRRAKDASPKAELAGQVAESFPGNEVIHRPPDQGTDHKKKYEDAGNSDGADAFAVGFLFLENAQRGHHYAAGAMGDFAIPVGTLSGKGCGQITVRICAAPGAVGCPCDHYTASARGAAGLSSLGLIAARPR